MAKILVLYYSMYGHIETMAHAVADGANRVDGVEVARSSAKLPEPPRWFAITDLH